MRTTPLITCSVTDAIRAVALPSGALLNNNFAGSWVQAAGYGKTSDGECALLCLCSLSLGSSV